MQGLHKRCLIFLIVFQDLRLVKVLQTRRLTGHEALRPFRSRSSSDVPCNRKCGLLHYYPRCYLRVFLSRINVCSRFQDNAFLSSEYKKKLQYQPGINLFYMNLI
ncbi:hypothetical protein Bpfe_025904 [Biomphalaria pfeifferi]|uniref:Secreted protein n=1 Tax=Biomphalaria pfeifferi TaxID=112525 RepID=A0AAD8EZC2_BIOPF|nr:hypothetical protein Bpfe_025904 [Biomphalaria pfeifferi]